MNRRVTHFHADRKRLLDNVRAILLHHVGADNAIRMVDLFAQATGEVVVPGKRYDQTRIIRSIINQLRAEHFPVCAHDAGYYLPRVWRDIEPTIRKLESRAIASFRVAANLRRCSVQDLLRHYQLKLPMEESDNG